VTIFRVEIITPSVTDAGNSLSGTAGSTVTPVAASSLSITGLPATVKVSTAYTFTVTAKDPYGNTATSYRGTVHFTSTDSRAVLPKDYTFTATDNGAHTFTNGVTFKTTGTRSLTATDTQNGSITGSVNVQVSSSPTLLALGGMPENVLASPVTSTNASAATGSTADAPLISNVAKDDTSPLLSPAILDQLFASSGRLNRHGMGPDASKDPNRDLGSLDWLGSLEPAV
jgi:hypothetical protein